MDRAERSPRRLDYLDALRGYAILGVVATHVQSLVSDRPGIINTYGAFGSFGVELFFVVSAFTLTESWRQRDDGAAAFYIRRFFRIAPVFWIAICGYLLFPWWARSYWAPHGVGAGSVTLTALLLHGWSPETINAVVPGDWSIAAEWGFYALFPALMLLRSWQSAAIAAVVAAAAAVAAYQPAFAALHAGYPQAPTGLVRQTEAFWLPGVLYVFIAGVGAAHASRTLQISRTVATLEVVAALALLAVLPWTQQLAALPALGPTVAFVLLIHGLSLGAAPWLCNRVVKRIGVVSFSIYLWHFAVITALRPFTLGWPGLHGATYALLYLLVVALTYALAEGSYRLVERPMTRLGRHLAELRPFRRAPGAAPMEAARS
jgi:exopolysaccharide production protein ExoZ